MNYDAENMEDGRLDELLNRFDNYIHHGYSGYFDVDEFDEMIDYYSSQMDLDKLGPIIDLALKIYPHNTFFKIKKAELYFNRRDFLSAREILKEVLAGEKDHFAARQMLAFTYQETGEFQKAVALFHKSIALGADESDMWLNIAMTYERMEKYPIALRYLAKIIENYPEDEHALYEILFCYESMEENQKAIDYFQQYVHDNPYSEAGWFNLGIAYSNIKNHEKAIEAYDFVLAIDDQYSSAYFNKALSLMALGNYTKALENFFLTLEYEINDPGTLYYIGQCYEFTDREDKALEYYFRALEIDDLQAESSIAAAMIHYNRGEKDQAMEILENQTRVNDIIAMPSIVLAILFIKAGKNQKARYFINLATFRVKSEEEVLYIFFLLIHFREFDKAASLLKNQYDLLLDINYQALSYWLIKKSGRQLTPDEESLWGDKDKHARIIVANLFSELNFMDYLNLYL